MALRNALRKMPTLGLSFGSPPMGTLTGPVRALSPAAGSRLMSHGGAPGVQTVQPDGTMAEQLKAFDVRHAELMKKWAEQERHAAAEFDKAMERHRQEAASREAYYNEVTRQSSEELSRFMKDLEIVAKTCTVLDVVFPAAAIIVTIGVHMQ